MFDYDEISIKATQSVDKAYSDALQRALDNAEALAAADGTKPEAQCCTLPIAKCQACTQGVTEKAYCDGSPETTGCD